MLKKKKPFRKPFNLVFDTVVFKELDKNLRYPVVLGNLTLRITNLEAVGQAYFFV